ncbi:5-nitroimidazole antibiotic resistance protein [Lachnoclostridium sp. An169]|uniref:pyridoxamine 5'-phosphate oxidase family protein n=1 Tax=Lachnoclostridium sp. An169 TaxID=1965569 RepID=UPI000B389E91|nr:pyridoxamine 5'-phosphate oxidase family protein [Lachnoclostridium sp. An169]OUP81139.1 5-nitroimidazole antibiotic resistance protein [Lachnoclostridium sp. An169]
MFRQMRRKRQMLSKEECESVLCRGTSGVLAVSGDDGYPYAVPLSYLYEDGKIFFHSAGSGHKLDAIAGNDRVSFCVIDQDRIVPEEYTTYFRSIIAFGRIHIIENDTEKRDAIEKLARKYAPLESRESINAAIDREYAPLCMLRMDIEHLSGKEAIELIREKERTQKGV